MTLITDKQAELFKEVLGEDEFTRLVTSTEKESEELEAQLAHKALDAKKVAGRLRAMAKKADDDMAKALEALAAEMEGDDDEEEEEEKAAAEVALDLDDLAARIVKQLDVDVSAITDEIDALRQQVAGFEKKMATVEKKRQADLPRFQLQLEKRAATAEETVLEADDPLLKMGPKETQPENVSGAAHFFSGKKK